MKLAQTQDSAAVITFAEMRSRWLPKTSRKLLKQAVKLDGKGRVAEALDLVDRALEASPDYVEAHVAAAIGNIEIERFSEARRHLDAALAIESSLIPAREVEGVLFLREGRYAEGRRLLEDVVHDAPGRRTAHLFLADALCKAGEADIASEHWESAERLRKRPFRRFRRPYALVPDEGGGWIR